MTGLFAVGTAAMVLALVAVLFLREIPLRTGRGAPGTARGEDSSTGPSIPATAAQPPA